MTDEKLNLTALNPGNSKDSSKWPLLLKNFEKMTMLVKNYVEISAGSAPLQRNIREYLKYGVLNLDKPPRPSSHEIVSWVKLILKDLGIEKTGHSGTLDPKVTGTLLITIDRATRLVKSQQQAGKEYVCIVRFHDKVDKAALLKAMDKLTGPIYQRPPILSAVSRKLRLRTLYKSTLLEYNDEQNLAIIHVVCQAGFYVRTLCIHLGLLCGVSAHMQELRRVRSGHLSERDNLVTMYDLLDAAYLHKQTKSEDYLRRVVMPLEVLLIHLKRIMIKDTCVNAICYGAKILLPGVLAFDSAIEIGDEISIITTKGECVCLAFAQMTSSEIKSCQYSSVVAIIKRVIMDRETYPRKWGLGANAKLKKELISQGKLSKYGFENDSTPQDYKDRKLHVDIHTQPYRVAQPQDPILDYIKDFKTAKAAHAKNATIKKRQIDDTKTDMDQDDDESHENKLDKSPDIQMKKKKTKLNKDQMSIESDVQPKKMSKQEKKKLKAEKKARKEERKRKKEEKKKRKEQKKKDKEAKKKSKLQES